MWKWRCPPANGLAALVLALLVIVSGCEVHDELAPATARRGSEPTAAPQSTAGSPQTLAPMAASAPTESEYAAAFQQSELPGAMVPIERTPAATGPAALAPAPAPSSPRKLTFADSFPAGLALAQREGRPLMLFFTAEWCHYCKEMAAEVFRNPQVIEAGQRFVCVIVDADATPQLCQQLRIRAFPTVQFLSPSGVPLNRLVGKKSGAELALEMRAALRATAQRQHTPTSLRR